MQIPVFVPVVLDLHMDFQEVISKVYKVGGTPADPASFPALLIPGSNYGLCVFVKFRK
jgi:hypothetical protein